MERPKGIEVEYIPQSKVVDGVTIAPAFSGFIKVIVPPFKDRIALNKSFKIKTKIEDGKAVADVSDDSGMWDSADKLADLAKDYITSIDLTIKKTGTKITTLSELELYQEGAQLIAEACRVVMNGISLGND